MFRARPCLSSTLSSNPESRTSNLGTRPPSTFDSTSIPSFFPLPSPPHWSVPGANPSRHLPARSTIQAINFRSLAILPWLYYFLRDHTTSFAAPPTIHDCANLDRIGPSLHSRPPLTAEVISLPLLPRQQRLHTAGLVSTRAATRSSTANTQGLRLLEIDSSLHLRHLPKWVAERSK